MISFLERASKSQIFWMVLLLAAAVRMVAAGPYMVGWYEEIWQYLEPAWHLVEGPWVQTWDFRAGIRSWLIPQVIALPMGLGHALAPNSDLHLLLPRLMMVALSLTVVGCATQLGLRLSRLHGLVTGFISAIWFELVFYAPRAMAEPIAFALLMGAVWLLVARKAPPRRAHFLFAGLLLGLCFVVRIQYAPTLLMLMLFTAKGNWRGAWRPLMIGGAIAFAIDAASNIAMGAVPFRWMWEAARISISEGRATWAGVPPPSAYIGMIFSFWTALLVPIIILLLIRGMRHYPLLLWMALLHLVVQSLIAHSEYRYILASTGLLIILAGLASADLLRKVSRRRLYRAGGAMLAGWAAVSALLGSGMIGPNWGFMSIAAENHRLARDTPNFCGFAVYFPRGPAAGSHALLREDKPIYSFNTAEEVAAHQSAFNAIVTSPSLVARLPADYKIIRCTEEGMVETPSCFARRAGGCTSTAPKHHINQWMRENGQ